MDPRRLELLLELSRCGSMREVAEALGITTSTVSQQLALLSREAGVPLLERTGRGVRLTAAGERLAGHAVKVLAALEAARADLDPSAEPQGVVRIASFATAIKESVLPVVRRLQTSCPAVHLMVHEHEPPEVLELLDADKVDLALTYDYDLAPASFDLGRATSLLWTRPWHLGVPSSTSVDPGSAAEVFSQFADHDWIVNSRHDADERVVQTVASMAGFRPRVSHRADSLELVQQLIVAGLGVALLPTDQATIDGVTLVPLDRPSISLRAYAVTRGGRATWPPLAVVLRELGVHPIG